MMKEKAFDLLKEKAPTLEGVTGNSTFPTNTAKLSLEDFLCASADRSVFAHADTEVTGNISESFLRLLSRHVIIPRDISVVSKAVCVDLFAGIDGVIISTHIVEDSVIDRKAIYAENIDAVKKANIGWVENFVCKLDGCRGLNCLFCKNIYNKIQIEEFENLGASSIFWKKVFQARAYDYMKGRVSREDFVLVLHGAVDSYIDNPLALT